MAEGDRFGRDGAKLSGLSGVMQAQQFESTTGLEGEHGALEIGGRRSRPNLACPNPNRTVAEEALQRSMTIDVFVDIVQLAKAPRSNTSIS